MPVRVDEPDISPQHLLDVKERLHGRAPLTHVERLQRIEALKAAWETIDISSMEKNRLAKQIMERIEYTRNGAEIDICVKFR